MYLLPWWIYLNVWIASSDFISIIFTFLSNDPVIRYYPLGEKATLITAPIKINMIRRTYQNISNTYVYLIHERNQDKLVSYI